MLNSFAALGLAARGMVESLGPEAVRVPPHLGSWELNVSGIYFKEPRQSRLYKPQHYKFLVLTC